MDNEELADVLERAVEAAGQVLNDAFDGEGIQTAALALHVATQPVVPAPDEGGWRCFVFGWMPQPQVVAALRDGEHIRDVLGDALIRAGVKMRPDPDPRMPAAPSAN